MRLVRVCDTLGPVGAVTVDMGSGSFQLVGTPVSQRKYARTMGNVSAPGVADDPTDGLAW